MNFVSQLSKYSYHFFKNQIKCCMASKYLLSEWLKNVHVHVHVRRLTKHTMRINRINDTDSMTYMLVFARWNSIFKKYIPSNNAGIGFEHRCVGFKWWFLSRYWQNQKDYRTSVLFRVSQNILRFEKCATENGTG